MKGTKPHLVIDKEAVDKAPSVPSWLSTEAKAEWRRVIPGLVKRKILTQADLGSLENYAIAMGTVRLMDSKLQEEGYVFASENGLKRHPATAIRSEAMTQARQLAAELGLTPVSRSRPVMRNDDNENEDENPLDI